MRLRCDPECRHPWWKCLWDNSTFHHLYVANGPLWWLCGDCRWIHKH